MTDSRQVVGVVRTGSHNALIRFSVSAVSHESNQVTRVRLSWNKSRLIGEESAAAAAAG